ncbi:hypothetical protein GCM10011519_05460 [Marmoricola endophyticus]|uniref:Helicase ATP-binding domain-containing protein n=1 Tax=Marmoricola endophyticus TaxID=2040280 RepID=A0A917BBZ3_9ACTN|nr:DEAD/DEAH box helicase family protein [Marmoricola endophyticus]GGF34913.1 hypothetical protein GCM10011519_05460 [Marmoricola endophyticus]
MQLRRHQELALAALEKAWDAGSRRSQVMLPPGAGKTYLGVEAGRRLLDSGDVGRVVVLGPNTAIQGQWARAGESLGLESGTDRGLGTALTALTYQSLAVFDTDDEVDEDGTEASASRDRDALLDDLHPNARALVAELTGAGPLLLVLDECHHLLEVWGRLLAALLDELPQARVLALTATPPEVLSKEQLALTDELFGAPVYQTSIPAVVREGDLVPFSELVWLTTPTPTEKDWLAEGAVRFRELTTDLCDPGFGDPSFLGWLDARYAGEGRPSWATLLRTEPEQCRAALRMHHAGLLALPAGAALTEEHRVSPSVEDWTQLLGRWLDEAVPEDDVRVREAVRRALPSVGYVLTRAGVRRGRTPVDRVLARSESKAPAAVQIVAQERDALGDGARALVLCDHEVASATLPADLDGVIAPQAGSARAVLSHLLDDPAGADALLVTGRTVAGAPVTLQALVEHVRRSDPATAASLSIVPVEVSGDLPRLEGSWTSRTWVRHVTDFFEAGECHVLVGTRGLLGEGWDARRITTLVDLTAITTTTAVVQTRGRALRTDPAWPEKVALTWSVVCVAPEHPRGDNDWQRLVRKHTGFFGADETGSVVDGVGHLDEVFSPYAPPPAEDFAEINARMLVRAQDRGAVRERWRVGTAYDDEAGVSLRVRGARSAGAERPAASGVPAAVGAPVGVVQREDRLENRGELPPLPRWPLLLVAGLTAWGVGLAIPELLSWGFVIPAVIVLLVLAAVPLTMALARRGQDLVEAARRTPEVDLVAAAVADAMLEAGISPVGSDGLQVRYDDDGSEAGVVSWRIELDGVDEKTSAAYATALDQALAPLAAPRYVVPRWMSAPGDLDLATAVGIGLGRAHPADGTVWHPVPDVLSTKADRARAYARAFDHWVGGGPALYTATPQGQGVLKAQGGSDPFAVSTTMRRTWD